MTHGRGVSSTVWLLPVEVARPLETLNGLLRLDAKSSAHGFRDEQTEAAERSPKCRLSADDGQIRGEKWERLDRKALNCLRENPGPMTSLTS